MAEKKDLKWFIEENYRLLTAMGVLGGLTTLFTRLENASYLTLVSLLMFLIPGFEFWRKFPTVGEDTTLSLFVFQNLSLLLIVYVAGYMLYFYYSDFVTYLPNLIITIVVFLLVTSLRTVMPFFHRHKTTNKVFWSLGYVVLVVGGAFVLLLVVVVVTRWLGL